MATERYGFFDETVNDERSYNADDMATMIRALSLSGVADLSGGLRVTHETGTMRTIVNYGSAILRGYCYELRDDGGAVKAFAHDVASSSERIDRIVLRLDMAARTIAMMRKVGVASTSPEPPALTRSAEVFELSLAQVRVRYGATALEASDVTDERADESVCGAALPEGVKLSALWARMPKTLANASADGLMSAADKAALDTIHSTTLPTINASIAGVAADSAEAIAALEGGLTAEARERADGVSAAQNIAGTAQTSIATLMSSLATGAYLQVESGAQKLACAATKNSCVTVTFPASYSAPPAVVICPVSLSPRLIDASVYSVTETGFELRAYNSSSAVRNVSFYWIAIGKRNVALVTSDAGAQPNAQGSAVTSDSIDDSEQGTPA